MRLPGSRCGAHCGMVLEDLCEYFQVDAMKYTTVRPLINASNIGEHLISFQKEIGKSAPGTFRKYYVSFVQNNYSILRGTK